MMILWLYHIIALTVLTICQSNISNNIQNSSYDDINQLPSSSSGSNTLPVDSTSIENKLISIRQAIINSNELRVNGHHHSKKRACRMCLPFDFNFKNYTHDMPIIVIPAEFHAVRFGNHIGSFLTNVACSNRSGAHMIIINHGESSQPIWRAIPQVIVHPHPAASFEAVSKKYHHICVTSAIFPWDDGKYWRNAAQMIWSFRAILQPAMEKQLHYLGIVGLKTTLSLDHLTNPSLKAQDTPPISTATSKQLPFYPDVLIHYRCSDNIFKKVMGILPFHAIISRIPVQARYIFIVTESNHGAADSLCRPLLAVLADDIKTRYQDAKVVIRRGGDIFIIAAMMMYSGVVICSPSSFCFYPAVCNTVGKVYLPTRPFYDSYINIDNIKTMVDARGVSEFHYGGRFYGENNITADILLKVIRDKSYIPPQRHGLVNTITSADD